MPQVRIRNVSKEYKLVAGVFSPDLLRVEQNIGKRQTDMLMDAYATQQRTAQQTNFPLKSKSQLGHRYGKTQQSPFKKRLSDQNSVKMSVSGTLKTQSRADYAEEAAPAKPALSKTTSTIEEKLDVTFSRELSTD